jgi:hypothetical protein
VVRWNGETAENLARQSNFSSPLMLTCRCRLHGPAASMLIARFAVTLSTTHSRLIFLAQALEPVFGRPICGFDGPTSRAQK